ncbi:hypothetical protein AURDEDRAFT_173194 [Auricularia subglabra TFB-10046 SS5]|nr:hypothetical protein AURDEDRAFT_173194 [Auricularia subglabra TFB-10046 SS5]
MSERGASRPSSSPNSARAPCHVRAGRVAAVVVAHQPARAPFDASWPSSSPTSLRARPLTRRGRRRRPTARARARHISRPASCAPAVTLAPAIRITYWTRYFSQ